MIVSSLRTWASRPKPKPSKRSRHYVNTVCLWSDGVHGFSAHAATVSTKNEIISFRAWALSHRTCYRLWGFDRCLSIMQTKSTSSSVQSPLAWQRTPIVTMFKLKSFNHLCFAKFIHYHWETWAGSWPWDSRNLYHWQSSLDWMVHTVWKGTIRTHQQRGGKLADKAVFWSHADRCHSTGLQHTQSTTLLKGWCQAFRRRC